MTFKVGDWVRTKTEEPQYNNLVGEIRDTDYDGDFIVTISTAHGISMTLPFNKNELKALTIDTAPSQDYSDWPDDTEKQEVEPSYYDFPQGIEVRHISAHLTSFGGQALQYVARATRLDGRNKGNPIEDLTKALDFIQWEIDRLRELE